MLVTHEPDIALFSKRCVEMRDGVVVRDMEIEDQRDARVELEKFSGVTGL